MSGNLCVYSISGPGGVLTGLALWVKANEGVLNAGANATDGQTVSVWEDQSGNRINDPSSAALAAPTFRNNIADNMNFNPAVEFDGASTGLSLAGDYIFSSTGGMTIFGALHPDSNASTKIRQYITDFGFAGNAGYGYCYGSNNIFGYTALGYSGGASEYVHGKGSISSISRFDIDFSVKQDLFVDGLAVNSTTVGITQLTATQINETTTHNLNEGPFTIGRQAKNDMLSSNGGRAYDGKMGEVIVYSSNLTATEALKVDSYLAVKYGVTLGSTSNSLNYLSSSGSTVWTASAIYQNDIAGIGRDDASRLEQKQSKSVNPDAIFTIGLGSIATTNSLNSNSFTANESFLIWGNDNGVLSSSGVTDFGTTLNGEVIETRLDRVWLAQESGTVGMTKIRVDLSLIPGVTTLGDNELSNVRLLVDQDGIFATGATSIMPTTYDNITDIIEFDHDFSSALGLYFTIGSIDYGSAPLPVELVSFEAEQQKGRVLLTWETATETNNSHFEIQRSEDCYAWKSIGIIEGAGNSSAGLYYEFADEEIFSVPASVLYYRLKQVDLDNSYNYSFIKHISKANNQQDLIYPNPAVDFLHIYLSDKNQTDLIQLVDPYGRVVYNEYIRGSLVLSVQDLLPGVYFLKIIGESGVYKVERIKIKSD